MVTSKRANPAALNIRILHFATPRPASTRFRAVVINPLDTQSSDLCATDPGRDVVIAPSTFKAENDCPIKTIGFSLLAQTNSMRKA